MEIIYGTGIAFQVMAWTWAFLFDGDGGADKVFIIMELYSFACFGIGLLIDFIRYKIRQRKQRRREDVRRRRQLREWKEQEWREAE